MYNKKQRLNSLEDEVKELFSEKINNIEDFVRKSLDTKDRDIRVHKLAFGTLSRQNKELASKNEELRREVLISEEHHSFSQKLEKELEQCKITLQEVKRRQLEIKPNNQVLHLGDGLTPLKSRGEIDTILYRNEHPLRF